LGDATSMSGSIDLQGFLYELIYKGGTTLENIPEMMYFNSQISGRFNPDINGYTLCFMVPPPFKALQNEGKYNEEYIKLFRKLTIFSSMDFTPPQRQVQSEKFSARTGGVSYATEVDVSAQCSVSYVDNMDLDIFNFHSVWLEFIHELLLGYIPVPPEYLVEGDLYGALDYAASMFIIKYEPSMNEITYLCKMTGIYPQSLPNKEIIGQRSSNEMSVIPITYACSWFEETLDRNHPIWAELLDKLAEFFPKF